MPHLLNRIIINLLIVLSTSLVKAQSYPFANYIVENGLSQEQVLSIFQDDEGVIWLGTSGGGITKFDGHNFEYITDKDGLADNVIFCMVKDAKGRILIGTNNGLSVYDPKIKETKTIKKIRNYSSDDGLSDNRIFTILIKPDGEALLGTARGISTFKDQKCGILKIEPKLDSSSVFHLMYDSKNHLWCSGLGNGVFKYDGKTTQNFTTENGLNNNMIFSVLEKDPDTYWFFTGEGLAEYKNGEIKQINPANINNTATYYCYHKDSQSNIWMGTSLGLIKQNKDGSFKIFRKENGLVDNSIFKIFQDRESNLWFGSDQYGVSKLANEKFRMYTTKDGMLYDDIRKIIQSRSGEYWMGSKIGISVLKNNSIKNYTNVELKGTSDIWAIEENKNGDFLIGTTNGLIIYNAHSIKRINSKDPEDPMNTIFTILIDNKGKIWLGTQAGLAKIEGDHIVPFNEVPISKNYVNTIYQDEKNNYWFGTDDGLYMYDGTGVKYFSEKDGFTQKRVSAIIGDKDKNLWFATSGGLYKQSYPSFKLFKAKQYLAGDEIISLAFDEKGNLWAGLSNGIDKIEFINGNYKIKHYGTEDGFLGQVCGQNALILDKENDLVIGTSKGVMFYQPQYDRENKLEPLTKLKRIDLFFEKTDWSAYSDSVSINNIPFELSLPYDKNYLTFNYIGVSLTAPGKVSYKLILKGIDKDWRITNKTDATYSNIPPGTYEFMLIATNGEGVWNKEPIVFKFTIDPPFWRTWWFYSIIVAIILSGVYSYLKIRNSNTKILKQNEIIEEKNEALLDANKEIAEKNQNITDSINYAKRIQQSFLTSEKILNKILNEHFILFKPRDIVSGDFYMAFDLPDRTIIVCSDCTGHGIPGAFMSLIGISLLNEISRSKETLSTADILEQLRNGIITALNPDKSETGGKDGMDISIIAIYKKTENDAVKVHFSGANSSMLLVSVREGNGIKSEFKGDKQPAGYYSNMKPFSQQEIIAKKGDLIYLFTDGYADQFGGLNGKKFMSKQLKAEITSIYHLPLKEQKEHLDQAFINWQGKLEQVDDVTVVGIKL